MENSKEKMTSKSLGMYFDPEVSRNFAEREQNEKNFKVAEVVDDVIMSEFNEADHPIKSAELGGGAHPDRYHKLFKKLLEEPKGHIDWVDISPRMLELAKEYIDTDEYRKREEVISFIEKDIIGYLESLEDRNLDAAIMKYTLEDMRDLDKLFRLLSEKLEIGGRLVSTLATGSNQLKSISTNARFLYNGEEFPENETRILNDGDYFTVKFFKESNNPDAGYLAGAETIKYYHSLEKIKKLAQEYGFEVFAGDWKELLGRKGEEKEMDQNILVLRRVKE